jgi:hypothetical protein
MLFISLLLVNVIGNNSLGATSNGINNSVAGANPVITWNRLISQIGMEEKLPTTTLIRAYALVHAAIFDSLLSNRIQKYNVNNVDEIASITSAASTVMTYLFPNATSSIIQLQNSYTPMGLSANNSTFVKSVRLGHYIGQRIVMSAQHDELANEFHGHMPKGPCTWTGTNPMTPMAGYWKTYILKSGAEIQPPPPYSCGSKEDMSNVQGVLNAANNRTSEQIAAAHHWGDTPVPTTWNNMLADYIKRNNIGLFDSARAFAYLNVAMHDSIISTWYTKYTYWTARPFQRIANFTTVIPTPNHPSYTSGAAAISAAASEVLSDLFPKEALYFTSQAVQAAMSRFWAGIHSKESVDNGFNVGRQIGKRIAEDMHAGFHPLVCCANSTYLIR